MSNSKGFPIYKFASLRTPNVDEIEGENSGISPETELVNALISINESNDTNEEKLRQFNERLQATIDTDDFIKTKTALKAFFAENTEPTEAYIQKLYDNVIIRTLTKSTANAIYKKIVDELKKAYKALKREESLAEILISERLVPSFTEFKATPRPATPDDTAGKEEILARIKELSAAHDLLNEAREENVVRFDERGTVETINVENANILVALNKNDSTVDSAISEVRTALEGINEELRETKTFNRSFAEERAKESTVSLEEKAVVDGLKEVKNKYQSIEGSLITMKNAGIENLERVDKKRADKYTPLLTALRSGSLTFEEAEAKLKDEMKAVSKKLEKLPAKETYNYVGDKWLNTTQFEAYQAELEEAVGLLQHERDCKLKFPYRIADLRVVEQQPVGYLPAEIAHINNTQPGEVNTRVTRRLKRVDQSESLFIEDEVFRETDTQSTEKFSLEKEASSVQKKDNKFSINASAAAKFGAYSVSVDTGYSTSNSSTQSNSSSQSAAKEVVESIVERVSNLVRTERSTKTVEEFEETVTHVIDNSGQGTKSYVYRWLNKLVRATLKNYGKRLIFQFDVAHPAHYYLNRAIKDLPSITLPEDPRKVAVNGQSVLSIANITRDNYLAWGAIYKTELEQPPAEKIIVSDVISGDGRVIKDKMIPIKADYQCRKVRFTSHLNNGWPYRNYIVLIVGNAGYANWEGEGNLWSPYELWLNGETEQLPVSLLTGEQGHGVNFEVECVLTDQAYQAWKIKTYNAIVAAYDALREEADGKLAAFDPNLPGLNPSKKEQLIRTEIKRETIRKMFRCNPFWINDNFVVGQEFESNCCADSLHAEKVRFIEKTFDWDNMTYELHPYFYSNKNSWKKLLDLADNNPHFEAFLQASFATVQVPVHRDHLKEVAAVNFIKYNSLFNYEVIPTEMQALLDELDENTPTLFEVGLDGNALPAPTETVDLGVFNLPTSLVILECGTSDGVKPIGFPQDPAAPTSDVIIPKQYSPAIIADSCAE